MRITGGKARGISLKAPKDQKTRPATDRMRESLFSSLTTSIIDASCVDLFAGTGSYGFEALSRDEIRSVNDKVPFLGDLPGLGRLFRSEGETRQKKNLLIFVTANLVNPGGSLSKQSYDNIRSNTIYQSPSLATPAGGNFRNVTIKD